MAIDNSATKGVVNTIIASIVCRLDDIDGVIRIPTTTKTIQNRRTTTTTNTSFTFATRTLSKNYVNGGNSIILYFLSGEQVYQIQSLLF